MKLYTEEQMRKCYGGVLQNVGTCIKQSDLPNVDEYLESLTPIDLPYNDEDAGKIALYISSIRDEKEAVFFVAGAMKYNEWLRSKILNQNK